MSTGMDELLEALNNAGSHNNTVRQPAEQKLKQWEREHFGQYLIGLCQVLQRTDVPVHIRQLAGLQVKILVGGGKTEESQALLSKRYFELPDETRMHLRNNVVPVLGTDLEDARKVAAQIVAKIASIELPNNEWTDLVPMLAKVVENQTNEMRESALLTLGYIGEELEGSQVMNSYAGEILNAVQIGVLDTANSKVRLSAAKALSSCLPFVEDNMKQAEQRKIILEMIFLSCNGDAREEIDVKIKIAGFQSLANLATLYYDCLDGETMDLCAHITFKSMEAGQPDEVRKFAIEFWSSVFEEELYIVKSIRDASELGMPCNRKNQNYASLTVENLVPILLDMLKLRNDDIECDDWTVEKAAAVCLTAMAEAVENSILQPVCTFIQSNLMSDNWQDKHAATTAIGIIMRGPEPDITVNIVKEIWVPFLKQLVDGNDVLRDSTAWAIGRIFQFCPNALEVDVCEQVVKVFCQALPVVHCKVASTVCWAIGKLGDLPDRFSPSTPLSPFIIPLVQALLGCTNRPDVQNHNLLASSFQALYAIVRTSGNDQIPVLADELLPQMIQELEQFVNKPQCQATTMKTRELIGAVAAVVERVKRLTDAMAQKLMEIYGTILNQNVASSVHEEAMAAIGEIAQVIGSRFVTYVDAAAQMISIGLTEGHKHPNLCRVAILVLGDIANACKETLTKYSEDFIIKLLQCLQNNELPFDLKPHVVETIGDLAMAIGIQFHRFTQHVLAILLQAGTTSPGDNPDQEDMKDINTLRNAVLECFLSIITAVGQKSNEVVHAFPQMATMLESMFRVYPDKKCIFLSVCLIEDMFNLCAREALSVFVDNQQNRAYLERVIQCGKASPEKDTSESSKRIHNKVQQLLLQVQG